MKGNTQIAHMASSWKIWGDIKARVASAPLRKSCQAKMRVTFKEHIIWFMSCRAVLLVAYISECDPSSQTSGKCLAHCDLDAV
jgi:hypothetical protein